MSKKVIPFVRFNTRISVQDKKEIVRQAKKRNKTQGEIIREIISEGLNKLK